MKVAILSESKADEEATRILIDAGLGLRTEPVSLVRFELRRGWPNVLAILPVVMKHVYYRTDGDALVIAADSNGSPMHSAEHDRNSAGDERCRLCQLQHLVAVTRRALRETAGRSAFRTAIGIAYPAIEAWYLCGRDPHATEAAWARELAVGTQARPYILKLKQAVYGTDRPSLSMETEAATREAQRLASNLVELEAHFPAGFGTLARDLRAWSTPN